MIRVSYPLQWETMTGKIILAKIQVDKENISGFEVTFATRTKYRSEEENNIYFWKWLNDNLTGNGQMWLENLK